MDLFKTWLSRTLNFGSVYLLQMNPRVHFHSPSTTAATALTRMHVRSSVHACLSALPLILSLMVTKEMRQLNLENIVTAYLSGPRVSQVTHSGVTSRLWSFLLAESPY